MVRNGAHLFMLEAGAAAGAGWDLKFLCGVEELLLQPSVQVLEVLRARGRLVVQFVPPDVVVSLCGSPLTPLQSVVVVVMVLAAVGLAVRLTFLVPAVVMHAVAVAVLVRVALVMVDVMEAVIVEGALLADGLLGPQRGPLALWRGAVLPHLVDEEDFGHVVYDEHLGPVRDRLGLGTTEMNVHDEDGERGGGCDHSHGGYVVLPWRRGPRKGHIYDMGIVNRRNMGQNSSSNLLTTGLKINIQPLTSTVVIWKDRGSLCPRYN